MRRRGQPLILTRSPHAPMLAGDGPGRMGVPRGRSADSTARSGRAQRGKPADLRRAGSRGQGPRGAMDTHQASDPCLTSTTARAVALGLLIAPLDRDNPPSARIALAAPEPAFRVEHG